MLNSEETYIKKAYHEAGRAWALYQVCFNLSHRQAGFSPVSAPEFFLKFCPKFKGLSLKTDLTDWQDIAYAWRVIHLIFLGGYAVERIKWNVTTAPAMDEPEFEKSYYATKWIWDDADIDRKPEQVLRETLDGLDDALQSAEHHWSMIDELAQLLLQKGELSAQETFEWITERVDLDELALQYERELRKARGEPPDGAVSHPVVEDNPGIIQESDLDTILFGCCGYPILRPFKCPTCGHIMVYCIECDLLFTNLKDTNVVINRAVNEPIRCASCKHVFDFINHTYHVTPNEWANANHASLLTESARMRKLELPR